MCPLRYVILGVSILLGIVLYAWSVLSGDDDEGGDVDARLTADADGENDKESKEKCGAFETRTTDYITGRYIYNLYRQANDRDEPYKAAAIVGSVSAAFVATCVGTAYYFL